MSAPVRDRTGRRPDESMTLLTSMMERPLDPGYAAAAARRTERGLPAGTSLRTWRAFVIALLVGALVTVGALSLRERGTSASEARADLVRQIQARQATADARSQQVRGLQAEVAQAQARALQQEDSGQASQLTRLETTAGATTVQGPGVVVTMDDAPDSGGTSADGDPRTQAEESKRVQSRDIQLVVNGLWAAGAEAVAINGQRLTALSAIRFAGEAVLVNYRPLLRPYTIEAIGGAELEAQFAAGAGGAYLQALRDNYGISASLERDTELTLPSANLTVREAQVVGGAVADSATPSGGTGSTTSGPTTSSPTTEAPR